MLDAVILSNAKDLVFVRCGEKEWKENYQLE
jgi:hypothetical protein